MAKLSRSDLRRIIKPIVREMVEETIEELLLEETYLHNKIQESVLKGGVISHVITEVTKGLAKSTVLQPVAQPRQQQYTPAPVDTVSQNRLNQHLEEIRNNHELTNDLQRRSQQISAQFQPQGLPVAQPQQQVVAETQNQRPDWSTLRNIQLPPDDDHIGMQAGGKMSLSEAASRGMDPLATVQGQGLDLKIIEQLAGSKGLWSPRKINRFLQMKPKNYEKTALKESVSQQESISE